MTRRISSSRGVFDSAKIKGFLNPNAPTIGAITDVGTSRSFNNGAIDVAFTPAASGAAATSYEVYYATGGTANALAGTGSSSPIRITGLTSGTSYSFYVKAVNAVGSSAASSTSASATATTVPGTPTSVSMSKWTGAVGGISYSFSAPSNNGGKSITSYSQTGIGTRSDNPGSYNVSGLSQGASLTVSVTATNANGTSAAATATATSSAYTCPQGGSASGSQCFFGANATTNYYCPDCPAPYVIASGCAFGQTQYTCGNKSVGYNANNECGCCDWDNSARFRQACLLGTTNYSCPFGTLSGTQCYYSATIG